MATRVTYAFGNFRLDAGRRLLETNDGQCVALNAKAFDTLVLLVEHAGEPVSRKVLIEALWPKRVVEENNLTQAISAIRRALGDGYVTTLAGRGYQFVAEVLVVTPDSDVTSTAKPHDAHETGATQPVSKAEPVLARLSSPRRSSIRLGTALAATIALMTLAVWSYVWSSSGDVQVAGSEGTAPTVKLLVLPFTSLSSAPEQQALADGLTDELIVRLQQLSRVRVSGRTTTFALRDAGRSVAELAGDFGVQYVLEGSVERDGDRLRIRGQLSDTTGFSVWAGSYDRPVASIFEVQDEIVGVIAAELPNPMGLSDAPQPARAPSLEAYQLFLQARYLYLSWTARTVNDFARPFALVERSLELDPEFARSWVLKSGLHSTRYTGLVEGADAELAAADHAAERAIALAPHQAGGYGARALVRGIRGDWLGADADWARARALGSSEVISYPMLLLATGQLEKGRRTAEELLEADPLNAGLFGFLMLSHEMLGDSATADALYDRGSAVFEPWPLGMAMSNWMLLGRGDLASIANDPERLRMTSSLAGVLGDSAVALTKLNEAANDPAHQSANEIGVVAMWAAHHGDASLALRSLDRAIRGSGLLAYLAWLPVFADVRQQPAFKELLARHGLVEYWRSSGWPDVCRPSGEDFVCD